MCYSLHVSVIVVVVFHFVGKVCSFHRIVQFNIMWGQHLHHQFFHLHVYAYVGILQLDTSVK